MFSILQTSQLNYWKSAKYWKIGLDTNNTAPTSSIYSDLIDVKGIKDKSRDSYVTAWDSFKKYLKMDAAEFEGRMPSEVE